MSKIDELIQEFCPEGVGSKLLGEVCTIKTGQPVSKVLISKNPGEYPVINSGREPLGFIDKFNTEDDPIGITSRGAGVGSVTWCPGKYYRGNLNYSVTIKDKRLLDVRFLYFLLMQNQPDIQRLATYQGIPALNKSNLEKLQIPIPPLEVQKEIVNILDKFTQLEAELSAELSAELNARRKQYEYYRNLLFAFNEGHIERRALAEICDVRDGTHDSPKRSSEGVPLVTSKNIKDGSIDLTTAYLISENDYEQINKRSKVDKWDVLISMIGTVGEVAVVYEEPKFAIKNVGLIKVGSETLSKYISHYLKTDYARNHMLSTQNGSAQKFLSLSMLRNFPIPLPNSDEQSRIVDLLEKFDVLAYDISNGLPAEINARRKQYEYYRTKLLTFQELPA